MNLSENQFTAKELMPETPQNIANAMGIELTYVYDLVRELRQKGVNVEQDSQGRYYVPAEHDPEQGTPTIDTRRQTSGQKAAITRKVKKFLAEMEYQLKSDLAETEPAVADGGLQQRAGGTDLIIHRTDDHFGEEIRNEDGDVVFNSEIAEERVYRVFDEALSIADARRAMGAEFDTANLLLGGDIVTGEAIYDGQAHEIDENLKQQISRAADTYLENVRRLSREFPSVQVIGQVGNHGELRAQGSSNAANADDILYVMLDKAIRESEMENVTVMHSDRTYYVNFSLRDWNAHLRHGHDRSLEHIGTSAGKQRWQNWLIDHGFDVAFRGHYHMLKEEPVNGVPVVMGGSISPQSEHEESLAISGRPMGAVHGATDEYPLEWTERIHFG